MMQPRPTQGRCAAVAFLGRLLCLLVLLAPSAACQFGEPAEERPLNLVLVVIDTLRADHLGCYGYNRDTSPNLDALAERSAVFDRAYTHSPWTLPSLASILTGLEPYQHGLSKWEHKLDTDHLTLAEVLQGQGYRTAAGVGHYILKPGYHFDQGFEAYDFSVLEKGSPHRISSSAHISNFGIQQLAWWRREPFFLFLHYFDPHNDYLAHPKFPFGDSDMDRYDSEVAYTDHHLGRFLDQLEERGLMEHTVVVVIADHGEEFLDHGHTKHTVYLYDEVIRIPLLIWVPGFGPRRIPNVVAETQLAPTILSLLGLELPPSFQAPVLPYEPEGFTEGVDTRVYAETMRDSNKRAIIDEDWKLIHDRRKRTRELYHLGDDPGERNDLSGAGPGKKGELIGTLADHVKTPRAVPESEPLSDETREALKALGYLTDE